MLNSGLVGKKASITQRKSLTTSSTDVASRPVSSRQRAKAWSRILFQPLRRQEGHPIGGLQPGVDVNRTVFAVAGGVSK